MFRHDRSLIHVAKCSQSGRTRLPCSMAGIIGLRRRASNGSSCCGMCGSGIVKFGDLDAMLGDRRSGGHEPLDRGGRFRPSCWRSPISPTAACLSRLLQLDPHRPTPAVELRDDLDYVPIESKFLLSQHFSAIAAAGPIVGPILAGVYVRLAAGADLDSGRLDLHRRRARHDGARRLDPPQGAVDRRSRPRPHEPALVHAVPVFIWIALVYIIVAFTDITASAFVGGPEELRLRQAKRSTSRR